MKKIILFILCFICILQLQAQFITKFKKSKPPTISIGVSKDTKQKKDSDNKNIKKDSSESSVKESKDSKQKKDSTDSSEEESSKSKQKKDSANEKDNSTDSINTSPSLLIGGSGNEGIAIVELVSGTIGNKSKLSFGGAIAKAKDSITTDLKTLFQAGGNFYLAYATPLWNSKDKSNGLDLSAIFRTKLGFSLPAIGTSTNTILANIDPGFEVNLGLHTKGNEIGIVVAARIGTIWASKDLADALKTDKTIFPYALITAGLDIGDTFQIVYSQNFFNKNIFKNYQPAASIGVSTVINKK